jgi:succinate-semialdehyde dehydrogenase/glutarate-semialdehyde dehydrogenase
MGYTTTNPYTNEVVQTFPYATDAEVDAALDQAHAAFLAWRTTSFDERARVLSKAAALARERRDELARLNTLEMGKLVTEALWEVEIIAQIFEYYAQNGERLLAPERLPVDDPTAGDAVVVYQPLGIVFEIEPWNVPYFQVVRPLAPQLMAGNVVVLKHASIVPQCAAAIETLMRDAGLPAGVFTNLYATHAQAERIIADPRVCGVTVTGSEAAGATVAAQAGRHVKKSVLELGGSDAMLVLGDADLDHAVRGAMLGRLTLSGQACVGDKRMIVADSLYDAFVAELTAAIQALRPGDPLDPATTLAPVSSQSAADTIKEQIRAAVAHGATATAVGEPVPARGAFVQPTILTGVTSDNPVYTQEIFGPVLMLFRVSDDDAAVRLANDTPFGLGASVYSTDVAHAVAVAARLEAGAVTINQPTMPSPAIPFGGIKNSGYGRELGAAGIKEFVNHKVINGARVAEVA